MNKTILICEDDIHIVKVCRLILEKKQYRVETSHDCEGALSLVKKIKPDMILLDLWLPMMGGEAFFKIIKKDSKVKHIPVILFSARHDIEEIAQKLKADGFLRKPFDINDLIDIVQAH